MDDSFVIAAFFIVFSSVDRIIAATGFVRLPGKPQRRRSAELAALKFFPRDSL